MAALTWMLVSSFFALLYWWFFVATKHPKGFPKGPGFSLPFLGNALDIGGDNVVGFELLRQKFGDIYGLFVGKVRAVVVSDFDLVQELCSSADWAHRVDFHALASTELRGAVDSGGEAVVGGVAFSNGPNWSEQRRYVTSTLKNLGFGKRSMEDSIAEEVEALCSQMEGEEGAPINVRHRFNVAVLNSLWSIALSDRLDSDDPRLRKMILLLDKTMEEIANPFNALVFMYRPLFDLVNRTELVKGPVALKHIVQFLGEVVDEHESTYQEDNLRDFTDHYLKEIKTRSSSGDSSSSFSPASRGRTNLVNVLTDFFIAGSDPTNITLNWAMLYMVLEPRVQKKVQEELDSVTGRARPPTWDDRLSTPYTEAVIHEVQRCGNVLPFSVTHTAQRDTSLGQGGRRHLIPAGTNAFINIGRVMKDPAHFPEPEKFDPSRYLGSDGKFSPDPRVIPFGVGRRRCLGELLARMSLYLFFTGILSRFDLKKARDGDHLTSKPMHGVTLTPHPYKIRFVTRK